MTSPDVEHPPTSRTALRPSRDAYVVVSDEAARTTFWGTATVMVIDRRGSAAAAVVALGVGVGAGLAPLPTLAAVAAVLTVVLAFTAPRLTAGLAVLVILFVRLLVHVVPVSGASAVDDAVVALCVVTMPLHRLAIRKPLRTFPGQWWFAGFLVIGVLSGLLVQAPPVIFLSGAFVLGKGLLLAWAVAQLDWSERHLLVAARSGTGLLLIALVACAANAAMPAAWNAMLASDLNAAAPRGFLPSLIGPFTHPIDLGQFMALTAVAIAAWRATMGRSVFTLALLAATIAGAVLTARRTASASFGAAWLWLQLTQRSARVLVAMVAVLPLAAVVLSDSVIKVFRATWQDYIVRGSTEARTVLTRDSFAVAADHFPGGTGFGRFGSAVAASNYSPEYLARGYPDIWGLGNTVENGRFLTDTEWPAILGEAGFLGAAAFALGLLAIYRTGRRLSRSTGPATHRWAGLTVMGWLVALLVESVGTVSFTGPPVSGAFFVLVGITTALLDPDKHAKATEMAAAATTAHRHLPTQPGSVGSGTAVRPSNGVTRKRNPLVPNRE
jgi:hypothetical protein